MGTRLPGYPWVIDFDTQANASSSKYIRVGNIRMSAQIGKKCTHNNYRVELVMESVGTVYLAYTAGMPQH